MLNRFFLFVKLLLIPVAIAFSQSTEAGNAFNAYLAPEAGVNPLSGTVAFSKPLASISAGALSVSFDLKYSGNVFKTVENKNDIAPSGWVGLGWALGRATIVSDHNGSMSLEDDTYYLQSAEGIRYKIIYEKSRFWIEHLPYWKLERITKKATWNGNEYEMIVGWLITDDSGLKHWYGDYEDNPKNPQRNATQHALSWPDTYGLVGKAWGGNTALYPHSWSLSRQEDLDGNWLKYEYEQIFEGLKIKNWTSSKQYTKETYLKSVTSSLGSSITFLLEDKGQGEFDGEYLDVYGKEEHVGDHIADAFIDPIERKYLSAIEINGIGGVKNGRIDFCYKSFSIQPGTKSLGIFLPGGLENNRGYVKRLLTSVIHTNKNGFEVDKEIYSYFTDVRKASTDKEYPTAALYSIEGPNCGRVEFNYKYYQVSNDSPTALHTQKLDLINVQIGYLDNGMPYLVGHSPKDSKVKVYAWVNGSWNFMNSIENVKYNASGSFLIGDKNWFTYVTDEMKNDKSYTAYPIVWNGKTWVVQDSIKDNGRYSFVTVGPNYIVKARISNEKIKLTIPWSRWGGQYETNEYAAEEGKYDTEYLNVVPSGNHIGLFYLGPDFGNNGRLLLFTFDYSSNALVETYYIRDLDDDNQYAWGDGYLFGATESRGLTGTIAQSWHWNGNGWDRILDKKLNGLQGVPSIEAAGNNYFALRHNDKDDLSLFDWDGEDWNTPYKNKNMVSGDDFDFFYEAEWTGRGASDFFIAREPEVTTTTVSMCVWWKFRRWKVRCAERISFPVWSSTEGGRLVQRFERRDGEWSHTNPRNFKTRTTVNVGQDWYVESETDKAFIWNGLEWNEEDVPNISNVNSLGGNFFATKQGNSTTIYYKINDSFKGEFGVPLVTEKTIYEPVTDKVIQYTYSYKFNDDEAVAFDYIHNTPLVQSYFVTLPENAGVLQKTLCTPTNDLGLGMGQICKEESFNNDGISEQSSINSFERYRNAAWPLFIYQDRVFENKTTVKGSETITKTVFNDDLNGLPSRVYGYVTGQGFIHDKRIKYAAEVYDFMQNANRLQEEASYYSCASECKAGYLIEAKATRYSNATTSVSKAHVLDVWNWEPANKNSTTFSQFNWNSASQVSDWKKITSYSNYAWGKATESRDRLGIKSALVYENISSGLLLGSVFNAGIKEVLLLSGETCDVNHWNASTCETITLSGNATQGSGINYGRFSKTAVKVSPSKTLKGSVISGKGGSYRFSAWVQSIDAVNRNLSLSLNGTIINSWTFTSSDAGKWKYVEWEGNTSAGQLELSLSMSAGTEMRLQDIRFLPSDASSSVSFWDKRWGVPLVQVDERSVGKYVTLDEMGRLSETHLEDEDGNVFLASRKTYFESDCRETPGGKNVLSKLKINGNSVRFGSVGGTAYYTLPHGEENISIHWSPLQKGDQIRYQLYPAGTTVSSWNTSCCSETTDITEAIGNYSSWVLKVDVAPFGSSIYTVNIQKRSVGWVDYGTSLGLGKTPQYIGNHDSTQLVYVGEGTEKGLISASFNGNSWIKTTISNSISEEFATVSSANSAYILDKPFLSFVDESVNENPVAYVKNSSAWSLLGHISEDNQSSELLRMALSAKNVPYAIYENEQSLKAVRYNLAQTKWEPAGSLTYFETDSTPPGLIAGNISEFAVVDADIALGPDNHLYTAYIGSIHSLRQFEEDAAKASPKFVIVKRLYNAADSKMNHEIWAGPSTMEDEIDGEMLPNYFGDILTINSIPLLQARQVRLASDGSDLYLAVTHRLQTDALSDRNVLSVFKGTYRNEVSSETGLREVNLRFEPLLDTSVKATLFTPSLAEEQRVVLYLENSDHFDFVVKSGIPYISFTSSANNGDLSVIRYEGKRWLSVGNPAFAKSSAGMAASDLTISKNGTPVVAFKESKSSKNTTKRNKIVPMKYVKTGDYDLTLSAMKAFGAITDFNSEFRQYILNYSAHVHSIFAGFFLSPAPKTIDDILALQIEKNDSPIATWVINPSSPETMKYLPDITFDYTGTTIPNIWIPLSSGLNEIRVKITGKDGSVLCYTVTLNRAAVSKASSSVNSTGKLVLVEQKSDSSGSVMKDTSLYVSYGADSLRYFCIQLAPGWSFVFNGKTFYRSTCFETTLKDPLSLSLTDDSGNSHIIIIIDGDLAPDQEEYTHGGGNDPGGGWNNGGGTPLPGTEVIPGTFQELFGYRLFSSTSLILADRASVSGGSFGGSFVEAGANASVTGKIISSGNVNLRSNANVENVILSGSLEAQAGASHGSVTQTQVLLPAIPVVGVNYGNTDKIIGNDQTVTVTPGLYKDFRVYSRSTVTFEPGDYYFNSFNIEPDVSLYFNNASGPVRIWVQGSIYFADRVYLYNAGSSGHLLFYTNSSNTLYIGVGTEVSATYIAPNGGINLATRAKWTGFIWAKTLTVQADAIVK